jgi:phage protein D
MTDAPTSEVATTPGTAFFAPQARLVGEDGTPILIGQQPVSADIISATVTLLNTGVSQVDVVLNNQHHTDNRYKLPAPSWRYNKLDTLGFGKRVRVDMRYGSDGWTPMILARITDMGFVFPAAEGASITLKGEDLLSLLKTKPAQVIPPYEDVQEVDLVGTVLTSSGSGLTFANQGASPFTDPLATITHEQVKSYLQFIQSLAERMDYEVFVDFDSTAAGTPGRNPTQADARSVGFHFEPSRSATLGPQVTLVYGRDIVDFKPTFKVWDILTGALANGAQPRGRGRLPTEPVAMADAINDLHTATGGATPINAAQVRAAAFATENRPADNIETFSVENIDVERAQLQAKAKLRASARELLTADVTTIGFPKLRPGIHVVIEEMYAPFDGVWYVTKAMHSLGAAGYTTKSSLRRPGMLDASAYPLGGRA